MSCDGLRPRSPSILSGMGVQMMRAWRVGLMSAVITTAAFAGSSPALACSLMMLPGVSVDLHATVETHDESSVTVRVDSIGNVERTEGGTAVSPPVAGDRINVQFPKGEAELLMDGHPYLLRTFRSSGGASRGSSTKDRLASAGNNCPGEVPAGVRNLDGTGVEPAYERAERQLIIDAAAIPTGEAHPQIYAIGTTIAVTIVGFTIVNILIVRRRRKRQRASPFTG